MNDFVSPAVQAMNLIREIGDKVSQSNEPLDQMTIQNNLEKQLFDELVESGIIKVMRTISPLGNSSIFMGVNLTLEGWEQYEAEKRGKFEGSYGFIAMQFGDPGLDVFVQDVVKPIVKEGIGYDLVDMRDVAQAGIIDDIMRVRSGIRLSSSPTSRMTTTGPIGKRAMPKVWASRWSTSANERNSRWMDPISIPTTAQRFSGRKMIPKGSVKN